MLAAICELAQRGEEKKAYLHSWLVPQQFVDVGSVVNFM